MSEVRSPLAESFSLTRGGLFYRVQRLLGFADERSGAIRRVLFGIAVTWLPLLILSFAQGLAYGNHLQIPFLRDFAVNLRFLVALPIVIVVESSIDDEWRQLVLHFLRSGLVQDPELPAFEAAIRRVIRLRDSIVPELILAAVACSSFLFPKPELLMENASNWHTMGPGPNPGLSLAGLWFILVSMPFFRFLVLRWTWRMGLWTLFLWRTSRIDLHLVATHSDLAAGLGFLAEGQWYFSPIVFALSIVIASQAGNAIVYEGATLAGMKFALLGFGVVSTLALAAPLLVTVPLLVRTKKRAILDYGALVTRHNESFAAKWVDGSILKGDGILGDPDPSSLIDLASSFQLVQQMHYVPINRLTLIYLALSAVLPMVVMMVLVTPAESLIGAVWKMVM